MHSLRHLLTPLVAGCWQALGAFWLLAAVYFALRTSTTATRRLAVLAHYRMAVLIEDKIERSLPGAKDGPLYPS